MTDPAAAKSMRWKLPLVIALTVVMVALVLAHVQRVNGTWYWWWAWRRLTFWIYPAMLLAAAPFVVAQYFYLRGRKGPALVFLSIAVFTMELTALAMQPPTFLRRLPLIVMN